MEGQAWPGGGQGGGVIDRMGGGLKGGGGVIEGGGFHRGGVVG